MRAIRGMRGLMAAVSQTRNAAGSGGSKTDSKLEQRKASAVETILEAFDSGNIDAISQFLTIPDEEYIAGLPATCSYFSSYDPRISVRGSRLTHDDDNDSAISSVRISSLLLPRLRL